MTEETIFNDALTRAPLDRPAYLDEACAGDPALRAAVEALLRANVGATGFLESPPVGPAATADLPAAEAPGAVIGPYKLIEQIGEGGMGAVWMAQQTEPVKRVVAIKLIKAGMDSKQVIARFEAERQALALMDHPNIAKVFDGGMVETEAQGHPSLGLGRPYFVMELVKGHPITKYCDEHHLTPRQRLELFIPVCQAVQHAHQKGIIHRDIKPSNVLVAQYDGRPVPKVIDFGVAKAAGQSLTDKTLVTGFGAIVGTLEYMSPEQAETNQLDIDTRSDIYSLGVLLYELLTGSTPFSKKDLEKAGMLEMLRVIREDEPSKPSTKLSSSDALPTLSANRGTEPAKLMKLLRGELDWIVMKALEKDRSRRYETANGFAMDVQRYLADEAVLACPPLAGYRFRKFARRNKRTLTTAALGLAIVILSSCFALLTYSQQLRERELHLAVEGAAIKQQQEQWVREVAVPEVASLIDAERPVAALQRLKEAEKVLSKDPALAKLTQRLLAAADVQTEPPGIEVFIQDWKTPRSDWLAVGQTPLQQVGLPRDRIRWKFTREGYSSRELVVTARELAATRIELFPAAQVPAHMVYVPAAPATATRPALGRFFIDRFEVTNDEFQRFVDAGGYARREFWKHDFVKHALVGPPGVKLSWEEALKQLVDRSGVPGPAAWSGGRFPSGEERFPVCGVSWYEAAAYAEFTGKSLPTVHHWELVAGVPQSANMTYISSLSNLSPRLAAVGTNRGIGPFDVYDMLGNVREWCWNEVSGGLKVTCGGACNEPAYMHDALDAFGPLDRSLATGFRCVRYLDLADPALLSAVQLPARDFSREKPATLAEIDAYRRIFVYDRNAPLQPEPVSAKDESVSLRHEIIRINAAYGGERFTVHMLLPRRAPPPHPTLVYFPGTGILQHHEFDKFRNGPPWLMSVELVKHGWAVCWPTLLGSFERNLGSWPPTTSLEWRDRIVRVIQDLSRSVDYLESRHDIDQRRIGFLGSSWGAVNGPLSLVVEPRFRVGVLVSGGHRQRPVAPEVEAFNYAPHLKVPVLMITGRNDVALQGNQAPFFQHLGSVDKEWIKMDSGHILPQEKAMRLVDEWLDSRLGAPASK